MIAAGALIVIETLTWSSGIPENSVSMSSSVSIATPSRPTSPSERGMIGVVAHQRRHVERRRQARLAMVEQVAKPLVGLLRGAESRELAHRPQPAAVHRAVHAARVRKLARQAGRRRPGRRRGDPLGVQRLDRLARDRRETARRVRAHARTSPAPSGRCRTGAESWPWRRMKSTGGLTFANLCD